MAASLRCGLRAADETVGGMGLDGRLEVEEPLAERVFVLLLRDFGRFAGVFFVEVGFFPGIDLGFGVVSRGQGLFFADGAHPFLDSDFVCSLQLVQSGVFNGHGSPLSTGTVKELRECAMYGVVKRWNDLSLGGG
jgi:hypothetical protein